MNYVFFTIAEFSKVLQRVETVENSVTTLSQNSTDSFEKIKEIEKSSKKLGRSVRKQIKEIELQINGRFEKLSKLIEDSRLKLVQVNQELDSNKNKTDDIISRFNDQNDLIMDIKEKGDNTELDIADAIKRFEEKVRCLIKDNKGEVILCFVFLIVRKKNNNPVSLNSSKFFLVFYIL